MKIQGKWFFFIRLSSLALVGMEIGRTSCSAVTFQQLVFSKMKPIHCVQKSALPKSFPPLHIPP